MKEASLLLLTVIFQALLSAKSFAFSPNSMELSQSFRSGRSITSLNARYGPTLDPSAFDRYETDSNAQKEDFENLLKNVMSATDVSHIPSILTKNIELILTLSGEGGVAIIESILEETIRKQGQEAAEAISTTIEVVISFAENFVEQAMEMDDQNKNLLGKIILSLTDKTLKSRDREEALDKVMAEEREKFTPGFLRHLEGECERIMNAPKVTPESSRLVEMLRTVQTRVLEELGKDLGEAAQVLGQLIGYEDKSERLAVLEAGLSVRDKEFSEEMLSLTKEAIDGFAQKPGSIDPGLLACITEIKEKIEDFMEKDASFQ